MIGCPDECGKKQRTRQMKPEYQKQKEKEKKENFRKPIVEEEMEIARIIEEKKEEEVIEIRTVEEIVFRRFCKYLKVFKKKKGKIYLLSRIEREKLQKFVKDQLRKGYIRLQKSPQISLVFFVLKKDEKKRMVQDYQYLNSWTIKNNYLLPLILDLIEGIRKKKVFMKMDLGGGIIM